MEVPWWRSRTFFGALIALVPEIVEAAGVVIPPIVKAILQSVGGILAAVGFRGVILRSGGLKG